MRFNLIYKRVKDTDPIEIPSLVRDDEGGALSGPEAYKAFWKAYNETQRTINALIYQSTRNLIKQIIYANPDNKSETDS